MGLLAIGILRVLSLLLRVLGNGARHLGTLTQQVYDLLLFVPLWIETRMAVAAAEEAADAHVAVEAEAWQEAQS
jgi:hypothetical protein